MMKKNLMRLGLITMLMWLGLFAKAQDSSYVQGQLIVKESLMNEALLSEYKKGIMPLTGTLPGLNEIALYSDLQSIKEVLVDKRMANGNLYLIEYSDTTTTDSLISYFQAQDGIVGVQYNYIYESFYSPSDLKAETGTPNQWHLYKIMAQDAWDIANNIPVPSEDVVVAVLDVGIQVNHPDLQNIIQLNPIDNTIDGIDNDENGIIDDVFGANMAEVNNEVYNPNFMHPTNTSIYFDHGTHVAGIAASETNNSLSPTNINYASLGNGNVKLLPIRVANNSRIMNSLSILQGLNYARSRGCDIINLSLGTNVFDNEVENCLQYLNSHDVFIVAATGNNLYDNFVCFPGSSTATFSVGATDSYDNLAIFSNHSSEVDVLAPGVDIWSINSHSSYYKESGTSMATPLVTSLVALMKASAPWMSNEGIKSCIKNNTDPAYWRDGSYQLPMGRINAKQSLQCVYDLIGEAGISTFSANYRLICPGQSVELYAEPLENAPLPNTYKWDFGDGSSPITTTVNYVSHTYNSEGIYTVKLIVDNDPTTLIEKTNYIEVTDNIGFIDGKMDNMWCFGNGFGLDFNLNQINEFSCSIDQNEGSASISNHNGELLFYTDGITVFNRFGGIMEEGTGLLANFSSTQAALIVPFPGNCDNLKKYYIFTLGTGNDNKLHYSVVDMSENGGLGKVIYKNIFVANNTTEAMSAVLSCDGESVFVVAMNIDNNQEQLISIEITADNDIIPTGNITFQPLDIPGINNSNQIGLINSSFAKFNPIGNKLAFSLWFHGIVLIDFDRETGLMNNLEYLSFDNIPEINDAWGMEFNASGDKIYFSYNSFSYNGNNTRGFAYVPTNNIQIQPVITPFPEDYHVRVMQLAPNNSIFINTYNGDFFSKIYSINENDEITEHSFENTFYNISFPNTWISRITHHQQEELNLPEVIHVCQGEGANISAPGFSNYHWSTDENTSSIYVTEEGIYSLTVTDANGCTLTGETFVDVDDSEVVLPEELNLCDQENIVLDATFGFDSYLWSTGETTQSIIVTNTGNYSVTATSINGCTSTDATNIVFEEPIINLPESIDLCNQNVLDAGPGFDEYHWSTGETTQSIEVSEAGEYSVTVTTAGGCTATASTTVTGGFNYTGPYIISENTEWNNVHYTIGDNISVEPGKILRITNSTIEFDEYKGIFIKSLWTTGAHGGVVIIDNSTLTSYDYCEPTMWNGIVLEGRYNLNQNDIGQAICITQNNTQIANSYNGISVHAGGILLAENTIFVNNMKDILFTAAGYSPFTFPQPFSYNITNTPEVYRSTVRNCIFATTDELNHDFSPSYMQNYFSHIYVHNLKKNQLYLESNKFINTRNSNITADQRGTGITIFNSGVTVDMINDEPNLFSSLYYGIKSFNVLSCYNSNFDNNFRGIFHSGHALAISKNNFDIGELTSNVSSDDNTNYGVHVEGDCVPVIQNNSFHDGQLGLYIENTLNNYISYKISNNTFENLMIASITTGANAFYRPPSPNPNPDNGKYGVEFTCNDVVNCMYGLVVSNGYVKQEQGALTASGGNSIHTAPAGNTFVQQYGAVKFGIINNQSYYNVWDYTYYQHDIDPTGRTNISPYSVPVNAYNPNVEIVEVPLSEYIKETACPGYEAPVPDLYTASRKLMESQVEANVLKNEVDELIDNGNTLKLLLEVESVSENEFDEIKNELLNTAPYTSDEVLLTFMKDEQQKFSSYAKTQVLIANSPLPRKVKKEVNNVDITPLHKYILKQYQEGENERVKKERLLQYKNDEINNHIHNIIRYANKKDTLPGVGDSVINILENTDHYLAKHYLLWESIAREESAKAYQYLSDIECLSNAENNMLNDDMIFITDLYIQLTETPDTLDSLVIKSNIEELNYLANINEDNIYSAKAKRLLEEFGYRKFEDIIELPQISKSLNNIPENNESSEDINIDLNDEILIYPNPASDYVNIDYAFIDISSFDVSITDISGRRVLTENYYGQVGSIKLNVKSLSSGVYYINVGGLYKRKITIN